MGPNLPRGVGRSVLRFRRLRFLFIQLAAKHRRALRRPRRLQLPLWDRLVGGLAIDRRIAGPRQYNSLAGAPSLGLVDDVALF